MLLPTTLCLTAAAVLINFWLGMRIGKLRHALKVSVGDGSRRFAIDIAEPMSRGASVRASTATRA